MTDYINRFLPKTCTTILLGAGSVYLIGTGVHRLFAYYNTQNVEIVNAWNDIPKGVVILHQLFRGKTAPNLSPFALKLETYLRMMNIPYEVDVTHPFGPKKKIPWISYKSDDGVVHHIADSQLIIEFLSKKFNKTQGNYSKEQLAVGHLARVVADEHLYWGLCTWRYIYCDPTDLERLFRMSKNDVHAFRKDVNKRVQQASFYQGIGRHSKEEVIEIIKKDLYALSHFLDTKKFILGDEPTESDCAVFGMLAQFLYCTPGSPYETLINGELQNLREYVKRMIDTYWMDWDDLISE